MGVDAAGIAAKAADPEELAVERKLPAIFARDIEGYSR